MLLLWTAPWDATAEVKVEKIWVDGGFGNRPDSITVQLYRDGTAEAVAELRGDDDTWAHTFDNLPAYKSDKSGEASEYTVKEMNVPAGYTSQTDMQEGRLHNHQYAGRPRSAEGSESDVCFQRSWHG